MSSHLVPAVSTSGSAPKTTRQTADFRPSLWGNHFLNNSSDFEAIDSATQEEHEQLKKDVRTMIVEATDTSTQKLHMIDIVQRLGMAYHFVKEIEDVLGKVYNNSNIDNYNKLHSVSLHFRLVRQHGNVFEKFKDDEGKFKASLINDVQGMLNLYEAAYFGIQGEDILDEALAYTTAHFKSMVSRLSSQLAEQINHALNCPLRKGLTRLEARFFMSIYPSDNSLYKTLLRFAKLDYNILQTMHRKDLRDILLWWKNLDFTTKLPYARDRIVEEYFWILGIFFEPQYAFGIKSLTKVTCMLALIDDTYDSYGTLEELILFTEAVERWDIDAIDILPDYMKLIYDTLGFETSCCEVMISVAFLGLTDTATKEDFDWLCSNPKIIRASKIICRLINDKASHKFEQQRGHVASAVECYMKQHGVSETEAVKVILKIVAKAWKDVNEEMLKPTAVSVPLLELILNYLRVIEVVYKDDDSFTDASKLQDKDA
ncbi:hypothetical protein Pint_04293 [Pistacia integerrima]|uniref:Uncharacterized protein n=1 Tax=Pistacia integerrima TaxID=434235 RepID=A0ACC0Z575_9ROSI|nr:hypothetical protein Pint_04293 [Pistacia integerrima]